MPMIQFVMFEIVTSVTIRSDDLISRILMSGNLDNASGCLKGELVLTITPADTQNQLLFYYSIAQIWISFLPCTIFTGLSMLANRVLEISGELQAELVLTIMPNAPRVSSYSPIQSVCCYAYETMTLEAEGRHFSDLVIAGGAMSFQNDSLWSHQWQRGCRVDDILFSVWFLWIEKWFQTLKLSSFWMKLKRQPTWNSVNRYGYIHNDTHILIYVCANMS